MTTQPAPSGALDPAAIAALLATAQQANHPDAWRDVALKLAEAWPAPKKARAKRTGKGEYSRVLVTFADGTHEIGGTYQRTKAGEVDLAAAERGAVFFRTCEEWNKARRALPPSIFAHSDAPGHTWTRLGGRWRLVPPPVTVPAVVSRRTITAEEADRIRQRVRRQGWAP